MLCSTRRRALWKGSEQELGVRIVKEKSKKPVTKEHTLNLEFEGIVAQDKLETAVDPRNQNFQIKNGIKH